MIVLDTNVVSESMKPSEHRARSYAELATRARVAGKGFPMPDGYIAATAAAHDFAVATRDTGPFEAAGVQVINPWDA
jgi:toxin FitB